MMIPVILCVTIVTFSTIKEFRKPHGQREFRSWKDFLFHQVVALLLLIVGTLYTFLFMGVVSPFKCIKSGSYFVFLDLPGVKCFDDVWFSWLPVVVFFMLFYGFILPGLVVVLLVKNRHSMQTGYFQRLFGSFVRPFKEEFYWWGLIFVLKRTAFGIVNAFMKLGDAEILSIFISILLLASFIGAEEWYFPFKELGKHKLSVAYDEHILFGLLTSFHSFQNKPD
jgi:hypothetical protein